MKSRAVLIDILALVVLLSLVLLFFWKVALTNLILSGVDSFTYFYPYREYAARRLLEGEIPLWNPHIFMGVPFLANPQAQVLYPPNWLFLGLPAPKAVAYSLVLHIFLTGAFTYLFTRASLRLTPFSAMLSGVVLALGGFLGAQAEHINLVSSLAWLPLLFFVYERAARGGRIYTLLAGLIIGLQFLAGHSQGSFISIVVLALWAIYLSWNSGAHYSSLNRIGRGARLWLITLLIGAGLAAVQLLPTLELASLSIRSGGLAYREAVSFSLDPRQMLLSLLPALGSSPFSEYIAYPGILALLLAGGALFFMPQRHYFFFLLILGLGVFLSLGLFNPFYFLLYNFFPGFSLFRVPARWLYLFSLGIAILAGLGAEAWLRGERSLPRKIPRLSRPLWLVIALIAMGLLMQKSLAPEVILFWAGAIVLGLGVLYLGGKSSAKQWAPLLLFLLVAGELFWASRFLTYDRATAPEAYSSLRSSTLHLLADKGIFRTLSLSQLLFDPGDLKEIEEIFKATLPQEAIYDFIVATKQKEVLVPNLSMVYDLSSVDGYDGGVLPVARFVEWERLLLPEEDLSLDGRLWQRLKEIPPARLLNLMNVKYVIRDKVEDLWVDGVYYDLGYRALVGENSTQQIVIKDIPDFPTTALGLISYVDGGPVLEIGTPVAEITVADGDGRQSYVLRLGIETGPARGETPARVVGQERDNPEAKLYYGLVPFSRPSQPQEIRIRSLLPSNNLVVRGLSLLDQRSGAHRSLVVSSEGRYQLVHSGEVKIYENMELLPRAFIVHRSRSVPEDEAALEALRDPSFSPEAEVLLIGKGETASYGEKSAGEGASILEYHPEKVVIRAKLESPGYLVLSDTHFPGWRAEVDGKPAESLRANYYFRAVFLEAGEHTVELVYDPPLFKLGLVISLATLSLVAVRGWRLRSGVALPRQGSL